MQHTENAVLFLIYGYLPTKNLIYEMFRTICNRRDDDDWLLAATSNIPFLH